jgi:RND family efflux transporter MFP subunit
VAGSFSVISMIQRSIGPIFVVLITALIVSSLNRYAPEPDVGAAEINRIGVYVERAVQMGATAEVTVFGEVRPKIQIEVISEVSGRVVDVSRHFTEGGAVAKGQSLIALEERDYVVAVSESEARLAARRLELEQALADADVAAKQLAGEPNSSALALKKPQVSQARAGVKAAELSLQRAQSDLARTKISLPFDARIMETMVDLGQFVGAGRAIASVFSTDVAEVRLPLTDADIAALGVPIGYVAPEGGGLRVDLSTDVAGVTRRWNGRLVRLDAALDARTRSTFGTVEVLNPFDVAEGEMPMAPGLFVAANVQGRELSDVIAIPADGLRAGGRVFVMNHDDLLEIRSVIVAHATAERAYVSSGVSEGDRIIVSPIRNPVPGMALSAIEDSAEPVQLSAG